MKAPKKCPKCGSKRLTVKYCEGAPVDPRTKRVGSLVTGIDGTHGFVCKTPGEHFHFVCRDCGYAKYN